MNGQWSLRPARAGPTPLFLGQSANPTSAEDAVFIVQDDGLAGGDAELGIVEGDVEAVVLQ